MRLLILAVCLAVAFATHHGGGPGYLPDREYHYRYVTTLYAGYSDLKPQYEAVSLRTDVYVQRQSDYYVISIRRPEIARASEIHSIEDYDYHYVENPQLAQLLSTPFKTVYRDGQLQRYDVSSQDEEFVVNIKRALLQLVNLNFDQREALHYEKGGYLHQPDPDASYYTILEDGLGGKCETSYVVLSEPYYRTPYYNNVLNVSKTRNYHNCQEKHYISYTPHHGESCAECEQEETFPLHKNSRYHYSIRGDRHSYVIENVYSEGEVVYTPYTSHGVTAFVYENRTLELLEERETTDQINLPHDVTSYYSLDLTFGKQHRYGDKVDLKEAHYAYDIYNLKIAIEEVGRQIDEIVSSYQEVDTTARLETALPVAFSELVRYFSLYNYDDIDRVYRTYVEQKSEEHKQLFYDILSVVGTNPTFLYGVNLIREEKVSTETAKYFVQTVAFHLKEPTEVLLDEFYRLCDHPYVRGRNDLHSACYLSFAGLVHHICVADYENEVRPREDRPGDYEHPHHDDRRRDDNYYHNRYPHSYQTSKHRCTPEHAAKYFNYFVSQYHHSDNDYYQIAYLKVIGNFGVRESIRYLRPYIYGEEHYPTYYRVSAIWALHHVAEAYPEEVLEILYPVYVNISENYELRIAAFAVALKAHPSQYQLEVIAHSLYEEPSDQVASFVYSSFYYLANSTHPCHRRISQVSRYILTALDDYEHIDPSLNHAFNYHTAGYEHEYDYGGSTQFVYIPSNSSYIPRKLFLKFNDYIGGVSHDTFAIGFQQYGLDRYFDRIFGPKGLFRDSSLFEFFGRRSPRDTDDVRAEVREVDQKLGLHHRDYEPVYGNLFLKIYGTQIDFFHFNESIFEHMLQDGHYLDFLKHEGHRPLFYRRFTLGTDKAVVYPLESGLPLIYEVKQPIYLHYHNNEWKAEFTPEPPKNGLYVPKQVKLHIDGHLVYDRVVEVSLDVFLPGTKTILGVSAIGRSALNVPVKLDVTADLENHKFVYKHTPLIPHEAYQSFFLPLTHSAKFQEVRNGEYKVDVDLHYLYNEDLEEFEEDYFQDYLGLGYRVDYRALPTWNDHGSWKDFLSRLDYRQKLYYFFCQPHFHPYTFNVTLVGADSDATNEIEGVFNYDYYGLGSRDNRPYKSEHFEEGLEDYGSDRKWYTHVFTTEETARGPRERQVKAEFTYSYSYDYLYHKYHLFYDRTPFHSSEQEHFKVCSAGYIKYPHHDYKKFYALETQDLDYTVDAKVNLYFGKDCKNDRQVRIVARADRSEEQKRHEARREEPVTYERYNEYAYYYQRCQQERQRGHQYNSYCRYYLYLVSQLRDYEFDITYENLPESFRNYTYRIASAIRHFYYYHVDSNAYATNPDGKVRIEANLSLHDPVADVRVYKPHETTYYNHIRLHYFHPLNTFVSPDYTYLQEYFGYYDYPYCLVQSDQVRTFDNLTYTLPPINCYKVIAKDCSPNEDFLVLGKKLSPHKKAVVIYLGKYKVEAQPDGEKASVQVNGKVVPITETEPYYQYVGEGDHKHAVFFVEYNGLYYTFHSHPYGLTVSYDGRAIYIEPSFYRRGRLCGLCGDYDGDRQYEFRGPEDHVYYNATSYGYSYTLADGQCSVPEHERPPFHYRSEGCTELRNRHIYYGSRDRKSCFTTLPLPRCSEGCVPTRYVRKTVAFHCFPVRETFSRYLLKESEYRVLDELRRKHVDHHAEVEYPERCELPRH